MCLQYTVAPHHVHKVCVFMGELYSVYVSTCKCMQFACRPLACMQ